MEQQLFICTSVLLIIISRSCTERYNGALHSLFFIFSSLPINEIIGSILQDNEIH